MGATGTWGRSVIRIPSGDVRDPLKRDVGKGARERALLGQIISPPPPGRTTLPTLMWWASLLFRVPMTWTAQVMWGPYGALQWALWAEASVRA